jgi:stage II sporulation protein D
MRRTLILAGATVVALPALAVLSPASGLSGTPDVTTSSVARVPVSESYPVPKSGTFTVRGHGYGHGKGMSQFGAQGAALKGLEHRKILSFYYPGTDVGKSPKKVRVLITGDTTDDLVVEHHDQLKLRDRGGKQTYQLPDNKGATRWRLTVGAGNRDVVHYLAGGTWRSWRPGGADALVGQGEFRAGPTPITLVKPSGTTAYRGWLRAGRPSATSTARDTVNVVRMDDYLKGVVPREVYTSWHAQALQAQAVAARSYASFERGYYPKRYYQICDTTSCQVYGGYDAEVASTNAAVDATKRVILTYGGKPAFTQFSSSSGGWTSAGSQPYLPAQPDPYDDHPGNIVHDWSVKIGAARIQNRWPAIGKLQRIRVTARDGNGEWRGRVLSMQLVGGRKTVTVSGDTFRFAMGLRSTWFTF